MSEFWPPLTHLEPESIVSWKHNQGLAEVVTPFLSVDLMRVGRDDAEVVERAAAEASAYLASPSTFRNAGGLD
jgi:hypothetical protein